MPAGSLTAEPGENGVYGASEILDIDVVKQWRLPELREKVPAEVVQERQRVDESDASKLRRVIYRPTCSPRRTEVVKHEVNTAPLQLLDQAGQMTSVSTDVEVEDARPARTSDIRSKRPLGTRPGPQGPLRMRSQKWSRCSRTPSRSR